MKRLKRVLLILTAVSLVVGYALHVFRPESKINEIGSLREIAPNAVFTGKSATPPHYQSAEGIVAFNTYDISPSIRGYAGPIKVLIALSPDGRIAGIKILDHKETKNYVHYMESPAYLTQFLGKSASDPFETDKDIDAISRATVSVQALAKTIRESSRTVAADVMKIDVRTKETGRSSEIGWVFYLLLFLVSLLFYFITRGSRRLLRVRDLSLLISIFIVGIYLSTPFSILHVFNLALSRLSSSTLWYVILASTAVSIYIAGRFYCGWICPFGALSEFIGRLPSRKWSIPAETDDAWRDMKYVFLGVAAIIVFVSGKVELGNYETYVTLFSFHGNLLTWSLVAITLLANLKIERLWCRYLCPAGALTGMLSRKTRGYPSRHDCPMGNKPSPLISECVRCNRCYKK